MPLLSPLVAGLPTVQGIVFPPACPHPCQDADDKARREANVRAALGAGDKPQPLKERQRARDEKKARELEDDDVCCCAVG